MSGQTASMKPLLLTLFFNCLVLGFGLPTIPHLITYILAQQEKLPTEDVAGKASTTYGLLLSGSAILQLLSGPIFGKLSDVFEKRRPFLLIQLFGGVLYNFSLYFASISLSYSTVIIAHVIYGTFGTIISLSNAYLTDITPVEKRTESYGKLGMAVGIAFTTAPALAAVILNYMSLQTSFLIISVSSALVFVFAYLNLPESRSQTETIAPTVTKHFPNILVAVLSQANPWKQIRFLFLESGTLVRQITIANILSFIAQQCFTALWIIYSTSALQLSRVQGSGFLALMGFGIGITQGVILRRITGAFSNRTLILFSSFCYALFHLVLAISTTQLAVYLSLIFLICGNIQSPILSSILANSVTKEKQGTASAANNSMMVLSRIVAPLISTNLYREFATSLPTAPFIFTFVCAAASFAVLVSCIPATSTTPQKKE